MMYNGVTYKNEKKQRKCSNNQWCTTMDNKKIGGVKKKYLTPTFFSSMMAKVFGTSARKSVQIAAKTKGRQKKTMNGNESEKLWKN